MVRGHLKRLHTAVKELKLLVRDNDNDAQHSALVLLTVVENLQTVLKDLILRPWVNSEEA